MIATGELVEESNVGNGLKMSHWRSPHNLPTKSMVIGVARFATAFEKIDCIPVSRWVFHQDRNTGFERYDLTGPILEFFEDRIAPYPFAKLAHVQSKTRWGGSENSGTIFYFEKSVDDTRDKKVFLLMKSPINGLEIPHPRQIGIMYGSVKVLRPILHTFIMSTVTVKSAFSKD